MHLFKGHPEATKHEVWLNGEPILYAAEADDVEGWVDVMLTEEGGASMSGYRKFLTVSNLQGHHEPIVRRLEGKVEFRRRYGVDAEGKDLWPYNWMTADQKAACKY